MSLNWAEHFEKCFMLCMAHSESRPIWQDAPLASTMHRNSQPKFAEYFSFSAVQYFTPLHLFPVHFFYLVTRKRLNCTIMVWLYQMHYFTASRLPRLGRFPKDGLSSSVLHVTVAIEMQLPSKCIERLPSFHHSLTHS